MVNFKLLSLKSKWKDCKRCPVLCSNRTQIVWGTGNTDADLFLLGEAPGKNEDEGGKPFSGRSGELLTKIVNAIGLERSDLWIGNTCLCRPPNNRNPLKAEIASCHPRLLQELEAIQPKVVVVMGNVPLFALTGLTGVKKNRGWVQSKYHGSVYCTYHPAAMLYDPNKKPDAWKDWCAIRDKLNEGNSSLLPSS